MSLLEDVFLQDEANEAQELERIIEGDEYEGRPRSDSDDNSEKEDEAEEDKRRVDPNTTKTRRVIKNPRFILNPARLTGPRGIHVIPEHFKDFKFKGKGYERDDLDLVLKKLEHWAYRLYPKFQFEDCLKKIETLGKKRPVMVNLHKIRTDQFLSEETVVQKDSSDEEAPPPEDEFDKLLQQQIELARSTPAPNSAKKVINSPVKENRSLIMPKATSSPSISEEQRERMLINRKLAEERRLARLKNQTNIDSSQIQNPDVQITKHNSSNSDKAEEIITEVEVNSEIVGTRHNRSNVIDSSDEEEVMTVSESVAVDVHNVLNNGDHHMSNDNVENESTNNLKDIHNDDEDKTPEKYISPGKNITAETDTLTEIDIDPETAISPEKDISPVEDTTQERDITPEGGIISPEEDIAPETDTIPEKHITPIKTLQTNVQTQDNSHKHESNLIISDSVNDVPESNIQETNAVMEDEMKENEKSKENSNNQELDRGQNDNVENVDDLMDVDFDDDF